MIQFNVYNTTFYYKILVLIENVLLSEFIIVTISKQSIIHIAFKKYCFCSLFNLKHAQFSKPSKFSNFFLLNYDINKLIIKIKILRNTANNFTVLKTSNVSKKINYSTFRLTHSIVIWIHNNHT